MSHALKEELNRFAGVVAARNSVAQLLDLFKLLHESTKFTEASKPPCFGHLIRECALRIPDKYLPDLQRKISEFNAAKRVRDFHMEEDADLLLRPLVARLMRATATDAHACTEVFFWLESSMIAPTRGHSLGLALEAGMTVEEVDPICDLTHPLYYEGTSLAVNRAPVPEPA